LPSSPDLRHGREADARAPARTCAIKGGEMTVDEGDAIGYIPVLA
jgi:hypothetical protein